MIYHIAVLADLHWGAMEFSLQTSQYSFIFDTLREMKGNIDLVVIAGDYWDSRVILNGTVGIGGIQWMHDFMTVCDECGVKQVRMIRGTKGHDNDQLEAFRPMEDTNPNFRIFTTNTYEETLPELRAIYCPEENMSHDAYVETYRTNFNHDCNIGFFHGGFDHIMPAISVEVAKGTDTLIFEQIFWEREVKGPMFGGHWHNGETNMNVTYIGTPDKWDFAEYDKETPPGIGLIAFDTDDASYYYQKIINPIYQVYKTYYVDTSVYQSIDEYQKLMRMIDSYRDEMNQSGLRYYIRIQVSITNEAMENEKYINYLRDHYLSSRRIKVETKNRLQKVKRKKMEERHIEKNKKYGFIKSQSLSRAEKLQRYILLKYGEEIELADIEEILQKYTKD